MAKKKKDAPITSITVSKEEDFSGWYTELINKAELADIRYNIKGFIVYREWATITIKKMYAKYEALMEKNGHMPLIMPSLIPESNFLLEAEHVEGFAPEVFWVTEVGSSGKLSERLALRPTSETALYKMYALWIRSYKDLPFKRYLSCQIWRYEGKMTRPFFRAREFHWIEGHDVFATMEGAKAQVKEDMEMTYQMLQDEFGIPIIFFERPQWDKFAGAIATYAADALMGSGKVLQLPSTHLLGQNFSKAFDVKFVDSDGEEKFGYQTCYGPAISRIYGAMIAYLGDDKGLILPFDLAPIQTDNL
jgi:prolyl-tRNA synthetase